ncbi:MAG: hypothetical protein ACFFDT_04920 [Candidatus Hodarchaeota archaeon]
MSITEEKEQCISAIEDKILNIIAEHPKADKQLIQQKTQLCTRTLDHKFKHLLDQGFISKHDNLTDMRRVYFRIED